MLLFLGAFTFVPLPPPWCAWDLHTFMFTFFCTLSYMQGEIVDLHYDKLTWPKLMHTRLSSLASHFESSYHKIVYKQMSQNYPKWCGTCPFVIFFKLQHWYVWHVGKFSKPCFKINLPNRYFSNYVLKNSFKIKKSQSIKRE